MDRGLRLLNAAVAGQPEDGGRDIMHTALYCMTEAIPLDPATWVELLTPFLSGWPELLRDLSVEFWLEPEPHPLATLLRLPADLAEL